MTNISKLMEFARKKRKDEVPWFCVHEVEQATGLRREQIFAAIHEAVENGGLITMFTKGRCEDLDRNHTFYRYNNKFKDPTIMREDVKPLPAKSRETLIKKEIKREIVGFEIQFDMNTKVLKIKFSAQ
jgi:hypothetical protein